MQNDHHIPRSTTTPMAKRGQVLAYSMLGMKLKEISERTGVLVSTCSNLIREAKRRAEDGGNPDLCATENLEPKPNALKGSQQCVTQEEKDHLVAVTLSDGDHCRMTYAELAVACKGNPQVLFLRVLISGAAGLDISRQTVRKVLQENGINRRKAAEKPSLTLQQQAARLAFCLNHRNTNWKEVIFTDESYFETGALRRRRARGVLRRAGPAEVYLPQNLNRKFAQGATVMFWGAILHGKQGIKLAQFLVK